MHQQQVRGRLRDRRALPHGAGHIGAGQHRAVVDAVADHEHAPRRCARSSCTRRILSSGVKREYARCDVRARAPRRRTAASLSPLAMMTSRPMRAQRVDGRARVGAQRDAHVEFGDQALLAAQIEPDAGGVLRVRRALQPRPARRRIAAGRAASARRRSRPRRPAPSISRTCAGAHMPRRSNAPEASASGCAEPRSSAAAMRQHPFARQRAQ